MKQLSAIGLLLSLYLAGCGESNELELVAGTPGPRAIPGCNFDYRACDVREEACQRSRLELTACLRGEDPGVLPPVSVMTAAEFDAYLASENPRPDPDFWEAAYVMLDLVQEGSFSAKSRERRASAEYGAFYRWESDDIVLIDRDRPFDGVEANALLVHEFVHALQDREVDLEAYAQAHAHNDDVYIAARAVPEGEAQLWQDRVRAAMLGLDVELIDWENRFDELVAYGEDWIFKQPSPLLAADEVVPYAHGARYLLPRWRDQGHAGVLDLFANPPASTVALMLGPGEVPEPASGAFSELLPPAGTEHYASSNLGALGLFLFLTGAIDRASARSLALTWQNDQLSVYVHTPSEAPIVVWTVEAAEEVLLDVAQHFKALNSNSESHRVGQRLRVAASTNPDLDLLWAVEGDP